MDRVSPEQSELDLENAAFWTELCGTGLARSLGITEITSASLELFDRAYLDMYPYLTGYIDRLAVAGKDVLEIGLGFGTLGQLIASRGARYHGLDIAPGPVAMMRDRLSLLEQSPQDRVIQGSVLAIPWPDETFDRVVSIGCLHHTGNLARSIDEVRRVLRPTGEALVMLYNRHSFRQLTLLPKKIRERLRRGDRSFAEYVRGRYDTDSSGAPAPHTDYASARQVKRLFERFSLVEIHRENFDHYATNRLGVQIGIPRERLLSNVARIAGLDLYIHALK